MLSLFPSPFFLFFSSWFFFLNQQWNLSTIIPVVFGLLPFWVFFSFQRPGMSDALWRAHLIRPVVGLRDHSGGGQWRTSWAGRPGLNQLHSQPPCVCVSTRALKHTHPLRCRQTESHAWARLPHERQRHSAAARWQGTLIKWELPRSSTQMKKKSLCAHLWCVEPQGFWVCLCVDVGEEVT